MSKQAETYLGQRAQTLAPAAESRMESFTGSPSNGEGFPTGVRATSYLNQTSIYPTSHLLLHFSAVPLSSAFSGDGNTFQAALKDERDIPRFRRSKTIKPHPAARLSSNVLFPQDGPNTTSLDTGSLPTPPKPSPPLFGNKGDR